MHKLINFQHSNSSEHCCHVYKRLGVSLLFWISPLIGRDAQQVSAHRLKSGSMARIWPRRRLYTRAGSNFNHSKSLFLTSVWVSCVVNESVSNKLISLLQGLNYSCNVVNIQIDDTNCSLCYSYIRRIFRGFFMNGNQLYCLICIVWTV